MALASCPCCTKPPELQLTLVDRFCSSSEVLDWMVEWRGRPGNGRKPHAAMFCGRNDVARIGGSGCREEGGCATKAEQCLLYFITAPYYHAMVPFLISDKKIYDKTVALKEASAKVKKSVSKTSASAIQEREEFNAMVGKTFMVIKQDYKSFIKKCPIR